MTIQRQSIVVVFKFIVAHHIFILRQLNAFIQIYLLCERERENDLGLIVHYFEISAEPEPHPSTSYADPQPSTSFAEPRPSTSCSDQSLLGSDCILHELRRVELNSDADLKGILVGSLY